MSSTDHNCEPTNLSQLCGSWARLTLRIPVHRASCLLKLITAPPPRLPILGTLLETSPYESCDQAKGAAPGYIDIFEEDIKKSVRFAGFPVFFLNPSEPTLREFLISLVRWTPKKAKNGSNTNDYPTLKQHNNAKENWRPWRAHMHYMYK